MLPHLNVALPDVADLFHPPWGHHLFIHPAWREIRNFTSRLKEQSMGS